AGVREVIDLNKRAVDSSLLGITMAELVTEAPAPAATLEVVNALVAAVLDHEDGDLEAFLDRRDQLVVQHEIAAVPEERIDLARRIGKLDAESAGDLVTHAGVSVLGVVIALAPAHPKLVEVAGQATRRMDDRGVGGRE